MRIKRIIIGALIGAAVGAAFEYVNAFLTFLMPPFFFFLPLAVIIGGCIGAIVGANKYNRLIAYLGILASIILGGILGLFVSVLLLTILDVDIDNIHLLIGIALGAFICGVLAAIHVRRYLRKQREEQLVKYLALVPENAGDLIKAIIGEMRYRKEVRDDVAAELAAHFEDELKDCATDEEKEQKAKKLITQFGDAKLLAVLLRRAKKRCRPLWRTVVARTFQTAGIIIVCFILYVAWFFSGKPIVTVDYVAELNRIVRPVADENLNAAPLYEKAAELIEKLPDETKELLSKKYKEVTSVEKQLIEKWLNDNEEMLELVIAGSKKPYYWQEYEEDRRVEGMMSIFLPHLSEFRKLARSLRWRAQFRAEQGRYEDAFDDMKACYRFGRHIRGDKTLVEQLVGMAIEALAVQTLRDILSEHRIDSHVLAKLQQDFEQMIASEDFVVSFEAERLCMYDEIQRCFTEDRFGGGHISLEWLERITPMVDGDPFELIFAKKGWTAPLRILFTHPNKQETREMADGFYDFWEQMALKTPAQIRTENIDIEEQTMELIEGNILLEIMSPALGRICEIAHRNKADVEAALAIIAILRYKQDIGGYPDKLEKLINADYLKVLPIDPYSGEPLVYKKMDNNFVLYSFGPNFKDDDGKMAYNKEGKPRWRGTEEDGDTVFWPVDK